MEPEVCPACGGRAVPLVVGLPTPQAFEAAERGEVILFGCCPVPEQPDRGCTACGHTFLSAGAPATLSGEAPL